MTAAIRVADEVWIATALLHRERPRETDFSLKDIEARIEREGLAGETRGGIYPHLSVHCVANRAPNGGTYRMLFETAPCAGGCSGPAIPTIRNGKAERRRPTLPTFPRNTIDCWSGTTASGHRRKGRIPCSPLPIAIDVSGKVWTPTSTSALCARDSSDACVLGHEPLRVPVRRRRVCAAGERDSSQDARPRRSTGYVGADAG